MKKILLAAAVLTLGSSAASAGVLASCAATGCQSNINVTVTIVTQCATIQANDIDFGTRFATNATYDQAANIDVVCNTGVPYNVELDKGINPTGSTNQRRVADGNSGEFMDYTIYQPSDASGTTGATTTKWGSLADGQEFHSTGTNAVQHLVATGRLTVLSTTKPGTYTDLVVAQLNF